LAAFPLGALTLLRSFGRPAELALAAAPAALSFVYWYGFTSYVMALPLVLAGIGYARRCALSGKMRDLLVLGAVGLVTGRDARFAFLLLLLLGGVAALASTRSFGRLAATAGAFVPGVVWSLVLAVSFTAGPHPEPNPTQYRASFSDRLRFGLGTLLGTRSLELRVVCVAAALLAVFAVALWTVRATPERAEDSSGRRALAAVALAGIAASLLCPEVLMNTWGLWERIPPSHSLPSPA